MANNNGNGKTELKSYVILITGIILAITTFSKWGNKLYYFIFRGGTSTSKFEFFAILILTVIISYIATLITKERKERKKQAEEIINNIDTKINNKVNKIFNLLQEEVKETKQMVMEFDKKFDIIYQKIIDVANK